jgi:hypothetical protein
MNMRNDALDGLDAFDPEEYEQHLRRDAWEGRCDFGDGHNETPQEALARAASRPATLTGERLAIAHEEPMRIAQSESMRRQGQAAHQQAELDRVARETDALEAKKREALMPSFWRHSAAGATAAPPAAITGTVRSDCAPDCACAGQCERRDGSGGGLCKSIRRGAEHIREFRTDAPSPLFQ